MLDIVSRRGYVGILFGRDVCSPSELPPALERATHRTGLLRQHPFWELLSQSRCLFVPNEWDASPRVIGEAIQLEVGVHVNFKIMGGWKYIDESNGVFFDPELSDEAIAESLIKLIERQKHKGFSASSFRQRYGRARTAKRLAGFLNPIIGSDHDALFLSRV